MSSESRRTPSQVHKKVEQGIDDVLTKIHDRDPAPDHLDIELRHIIASCGDITRSSFYNASSWTYLAFEYSSVEYHKDHGEITVDKDRWIEEREGIGLDLMCEVDECEAISLYREGMDRCDTHAEHDDEEAPAGSVDEIADKYVCTHCDEVLESSDDVRDHVRKQHPEEVGLDE